MRITVCRAEAGLAMVLAALLAGCGAVGGTKPNSQIREIDVATNVVNTLTNTDTTSILVNGGGTDITVPYGNASHYLYVQAGSSSFQGTTTMPLPTLTVPGTTGGSPTTTTVDPQASFVSLRSGGVYSAYLVGRPDVANPTQTDLSDLDKHFLSVVAVEDDTQPTPPTGEASLRVLDAIVDPSTTAINVTVNNAATPTFAAVPYATQAVPVSANVFVPAGTVNIKVAGATSNTPITLIASSETLVAGHRYTLVIVEPTALTPVGIVPPIPPATADTYSTVLIQE